ncbi:GNAT family N-acetyltransferase [Pannonibacter tanglangensis]|uniref:GNAT family N-acetyltransferase n=1 Tax=Pannonibacter tanglangensis TaxID=2750084 RepID=A0ABW9ZDD7_9HYPH|nr:GNAT family N-acetyltransferase [Pannonibacter sp. XCT-34]NBN62506.1 GNAT family N-acetyltransferase [Pannonibacter sp. XCT-34]
MAQADKTGQTPRFAPVLSVAGYDIELHDDLGSVAPRWLALESGGLSCLYHRHDWLAAWQAHVGSPLAHRPLLALGRRDGETAFLWPLALVEDRSLGVPLRRLSWLGARHGNQNTGVWAPETYARFTSGEAGRCLREIARGAGADLVRLEHIPETWAGRPHPMAGLPGQASVNAVHAGPLGAPYDALLRRRHDRDARRKLDKKRKALARLGPVVVETATSPEARAEALAAFLAQRAARAASAGIPNVFGDPALAGFVAALLAPADGRPPVLTAALLRVGGVIRATYLTGQSGTTLHAYANSIAQDDSLQHSPGVLLLAGLIEAAAGDPSLDTLDLGLGDERYKQAWTDPLPLRDISLATSTAGRLAGAVAAGLSAGKRRLRASPRLWSLIRSLRRLGARRVA